MRSYTVLFATLLCLASNPASGSEIQDEGSIRRKASSVTAAPKPTAKKPNNPVSTDPTPSTEEAGSGGTDTTSGSTGTSSGGTGSSSSSNLSSGTGGSGGVASASESSLHTAGPSPARKGTLVMLGIAAVAGVAIAAVAVPKRRVDTPAHPLKGSVNRRINLFSHLANHAKDRTRPSRVEDGEYVNADEIIV